MVPEELRSTARDIREAAEGLRRMVANLLDASQEESPLVPRMSEFDVLALLAEVARDFTLRIQGSHRTFTQTVRVGEALVQADRDLLRRTLENLLDNSFRFTALGSGKVALEASQPEPGLLELRVRDEGPGIPAASRAHVFEPHLPDGAPTAARARASHSVGLTFCRRAVQAHGGWIWVEDNLPRGTSFCLRLPLRPALVGSAPSAA
jgi:signal transduction histidine kinase